jgi:hypothetical protein
LRIYGDGSAGSLAVTATGNLLTLAGSANLQFTNVTVDAGVTLTVPSGTLIRCTGTFANHGTIAVATGEISGGQGAVPGAGVSHQPAGNSVTGPDAFILDGAAGGVGLSADEAALLLVVTPSAGGAGGGLFLGFGDKGGAGGGGLVVLAQGAIVSTGAIRADGQSASLSGAAGGAGGIVILASPASVTNAGQISARGGNGASASFSDGGGGGGGGGIVHLISPSITTTGGTVSVTGGTGGTGGTGSAGARFSGAGGGACGGNGGSGGSVINAPINTLEAGGSGTAGYSFETLENPTALFW